MICVLMFFIFIWLLGQIVNQLVNQLVGKPWVATYYNTLFMFVGCVIIARKSKFWIPLKLIL